MLRSQFIPSFIPFLRAPVKAGGGKGGKKPSFPAHLEVTDEYIRVQVETNLQNKSSVSASQPIIFLVSGKGGDRRLILGVRGKGVSVGVVQDLVQDLVQGLALALDAL